MKMEKLWPMLASVMVLGVFSSLIQKCYPEVMLTERWKGAGRGRHHIESENGSRSAKQLVWMVCTVVNQGRTRRTMT